MSDAVVSEGNPAEEAVASLVQPDVKEAIRQLLIHVIDEVAAASVVCPAEVDRRRHRRLL